MTKTKNDNFCFELLSHKQFAFFCVLKVLFFFSFFTLLHKCIDVIEVEEKLLLTGKLLPSKINLNKSNTRRPANTFAKHPLFGRNLLQNKTLNYMNKSMFFGIKISRPFLTSYHIKWEEFYLTLILSFEGGYFKIRIICKGA